MVIGLTMKLRDVPNEVLKEKAAEIGSTFGYLYLVKLGHRTAGRKLAERIEKVLGIPKEKVIWPETDCENQKEASQ